MKKMEIVSATELATVRDLAHRIWPDTYGEILSPEQISFMLDKMYDLQHMKEEQRNGTIFELAELDGHPIGFIAYGPPDTHAALKLHKLYLLPEYHGCGYGSQLLQYVIAAGRRLGCRAVSLNVNKNNLQAIKSYRRNGFEVAESVVIQIGNGFVMNDYVMKHELK